MSPQDISLANFAYLFVFGCACFNSLSKYFYMSYRLIFGTIYPAYKSFKALQSRDNQECVSMASVVFIWPWTNCFLPRSVWWCTGWCSPPSAQSKDGSTCSSASGCHFITKASWFSFFGSCHHIATGPSFYMTTLSKLNWNNMRR